jgi:hypothetical protein
MKDNDLSDAPMMRVGVVFEGAVAFLRQEDEQLFGRLMDRQHYAAALQLFRLNPMAIRVISDRVYRGNIKIDLITYLGGSAWADAIADAMDAEELPYNQVIATRPDVLARTISWTPGLLRIYDPFPEHRLLFGAKGRYLSDINQIGRS